MPPRAGTVVLISRPEETHARPPRPDRAVSIPRTPVVRQRRLERRRDRRSRRPRDPGTRGPPPSGNGGWSAGAIAVHAAHASLDPATGPGHRGHASPWPAVSVSLHAPPPLDVPLTMEEAEDGGVVASYDGRPVLSARCSREPVTDVGPVLPDEARAAMSSFVGLATHPFPTCF